MRLLVLLLIGALVLLAGFSPATTRAVAPSATSVCQEALVWPDTRLKDHTLFFYDDAYYIASINIPLPDTGFPLKEQNFVYARTQDFCSWELLGTVLDVGDPGAPDEQAVWAPHVIAYGDIYFMFYTGVNRNFAQTTMLATSTNPANVRSWQPQGAVLVPSDESIIYPGPETWSDHRDPMVLAHDGQFYLYYTATGTVDGVRGGVIGVATAPYPWGPWDDQGAIYLAPPSIVPESPTVLERDGTFYLFFHASGAIRQQLWYTAATPQGPWQYGGPLAPGWAYEVELDVLAAQEQVLVSYLYGYGEGIRVSTLEWDDRRTPPVPRISGVSQLMLPLVIR